MLGQIKKREMKIKTEILIDKDKPLFIENQSNEIREFIAKIQEKYPDWEEFILSNHKTKPIRLLKLKDKIVFIGITKAFVNLIAFLDKYNNNWKRFGISNTDFPVIGDFMFEEGMLIRSSLSNTYQYALVKGVEGDKVNCFQEGADWSFSINVFKEKKYRYRLLCSNLNNKEEYIGFGWPEPQKKIKKVVKELIDNK
jgi:hypothetical protein